METRGMGDDGSVTVEANNDDNDAILLGICNPQPWRREGWEMTGVSQLSVLMGPLRSSFGLNHDIRWFTMSPPPMLDAQKAAGVIPGEDRLGDRGVKTSRSSLMLDSLRESACERMAGERANGMRAIEGIEIASPSVIPFLDDGACLTDREH
ncbi:hypothetical protein F5887DRAFT_918802 [Amanita rubescens]|nr:hypothetical protein F5887DRAFT_918802 [Amanita rubescens]